MEEGPSRQIRAGEGIRQRLQETSQTVGHKVFQNGTAAGLHTDEELHEKLWAGVAGLESAE